MLQPKPSQILRVAGRKYLNLNIILNGRLLRMTRSIVF